MSDKPDAAVFEQWRDELAGQPVHALTGVVSHEGPSSIRLGRDNQWIFHIQLDAWRLSGGELRDRPIRLFRMLAFDEINPHARRTPRLRVIGFKCRLLANGEAGMIEEIMSPVDDGELAECARPPTPPVTHEVPGVGLFTLDRALESFQGRIKFVGEMVDVNLDEPADSPKQLDGAGRTLAAIWADQAGWNRRVRACASQHLLELKNGNWLDEERDEKPVAREQFERRLNLLYVSAKDDGTIYFEFDDDNMFFGHRIHVYGNLTDGPNDADI